MRFKSAVGNGKYVHAKRLTFQNSNVAATVIFIFSYYFFLLLIITVTDWTGHVLLVRHVIILNLFITKDHFMIFFFF